MTAEEKSLICTEWRDGKNKDRARVEQLAQLHACAVSEVCEVVGVDPEKYKAGTRRVVNSYGQTVKDDVVKAVLLEGASQKEAAGKFGVPAVNVSAWVRKAKEKQQRMMDEADQLAKPPEATVKAQVQARDRAFAQKILAELQAGIDGLHAFLDNFAGVDILSDDERDVLERILSTASGFKEGVETGLTLAGKEK